MCATSARAASRFWLVEDYAVPLVALEFAFAAARRRTRPARRARRRCSPACSTRARAISTRRPSSRRSTRRRSRLDFRNERDYFGGRMRTLARHLDRPANCCASPSTRRASTRRRSSACASSSTPGFATRPTIPARWRPRPGARDVFPGHPYGAADRRHAREPGADRAADLAARGEADVTRGGWSSPSSARSTKRARPSSSTRRSPICRPRAILSRAGAPFARPGRGRRRPISTCRNRPSASAGRRCARRPRLHRRASSLAHVLAAARALPRACSAK